MLKFLIICGCIIAGIITITMVVTCITIIVMLVKSTMEMLHEDD
jgi:hypothetical protein